MNNSDLKNLLEAYSKINQSQRLLQEDDTEIKEPKETKSALLTVRLPYGVKEDLERVAKERGVKMTPVVESYFVAAKAMDKIKSVFPALYDKFMQAQSPEEIKVILEQLVSREIRLESTIQEGFIDAAKSILSHVFDKIKQFGKTTGDVLGFLSEIIFIYMKKGHNAPNSEQEEDDNWEQELAQARKSYIPKHYRTEDNRDEHDPSL